MLPSSIANLEWWKRNQRAFLRQPLGERERTKSYSREKKRSRGAQGRNRTTDTAIFSRMLYQLSYLGISCGPDKRRACRAGRFIVALDPAVHLASLSASQGVADPQIPAESALFCVHVGVRQAQHNVEPESQRSGRRHGSATSKKAAWRLGPACRRSEKAAPCERRLLSLQRH